MKPTFTLSKGIVLAQYATAKGISDYVSYSSKTNPIVTSILEENTNSLFSIHLVNELKNVKDHSRIVFLAQAWNHELIEKLLELGVIWFIVDNESDLDMLLNYLDTHKINQKINLLLRLKLKENTLRTEKFYVFGMRSEIINVRIRQLHDHSAIDKLGVHFHRKTQNVAEWNLEYEISQVLDADTIKAISILNIGGGLPSNYANTNVNVLQSIFRKIEEFRSWALSKNIKLMIEPGRFIAAPAGKLCTTILAIHDNTIIVNASVYNSDMDALIVPVKLLVEGEISKEEVKNNMNAKAYVIKGITPCSLDLFRYKVYLSDPKVGDTLVFLNSGAYNFTTDFCDLEKIETVIVE